MAAAAAEAGCALRTSAASDSTATVAVPVCIFPVFSVNGTVCARRKVERARFAA
jgi:hypothetical protein